MNWSRYRLRKHYLRMFQFSVADIHLSSRRIIFLKEASFVHLLWLQCGGRGNDSLVVEIERNKNKWILDTTENGERFIIALQFMFSYFSFVQEQRHRSKNSVVCLCVVCGHRATIYESCLITIFGVDEIGEIEEKKKRDNRWYTLYVRTITMKNREKKIN